MSANGIGLKSRLAYEEAIKAYQDKPLPSSLFYIVMDLNALKHTNDTLGHARGDELIKGAARCIKKALGQDTDIYRMGGDEFAAIVTSEENEIREDIAALKVRTEEWSGTHSLFLSISCGYAQANETDTIATLCERADKKMYEEKARFYKESGFDRRRRN
ncbi:MAG: GGDEF domain-containing protein [Treponema sp.]|nr:GGDEF domain-containing protein [Treponema sp.]